MEHQPSPTQEDRLAAHLNLSEGVRRRGPAFAGFAEAVGHLTAARDPELFERSLLGRWPSMDVFVQAFVVESGLADQLASVPEVLRPYVGIVHDRVADHLRTELLVVETEEWVYAFERSLL